MVGLLGREVGGRGDRVVALSRQGVFHARGRDRAAIQGTEIRTLDSVSFNAAFTAFDRKRELFDLAIDRMRPGYKPAVEAWIATQPLKNSDAVPDPSYMPQYRIPQETQARALDAKADELFNKGQSAASTADKYVRLTVFLAAVLFLVGISSHFPVRAARYGLLGMASLMLVFSVAQLLGLPGPPT